MKSVVYFFLFILYLSPAYSLNTDVKEDTRLVVPRRLQDRKPPLTVFNYYCHPRSDAYHIRFHKGETVWFDEESEWEITCAYPSDRPDYYKVSSGLIGYNQERLVTSASEVSLRTYCNMGDEKEALVGSLNAGLLIFSLEDMKEQDPKLIALSLSMILRQAAERGAHMAYTNVPVSSGVLEDLLLEANFIPGNLTPDFVTNVPFHCYTKFLLVSETCVAGSSSSVEDEGAASASSCMVEWREEEDSDAEPSIGFFVRNSKGSVLGGLLATLNLDSVIPFAHVDCFWLSESLRGQGLGRRTLFCAENYFRDEGARAIDLTTETHHAPGFYAREGYTLADTMHKVTKQRDGTSGNSYSFYKILE